MTSLRSRLFILISKTALCCSNKLSSFFFYFSASHVSLSLFYFIWAPGWTKIFISFKYLCFLFIHLWFIVYTSYTHRSKWTLGNGSRFHTCDNTHASSALLSLIFLIISRQKWSLRDDLYYRILYKTFGSLRFIVLDAYCSFLPLRMEVAVAVRNAILIFQLCLGSFLKENINAPIYRFWFLTLCASISRMVSAISLMKWQILYAFC